jgi:N-formylglutamate amidohydrolase
MLRIITPILLALFFLGPAIAADAAAAKYVEYLPGTMPLILEVPHDGTEAYPGVAERTNPKGFPAFRKGRDTNTAELARKLQAMFSEKTGKKPYIVIMKLARKWVDVNREEERGVENEKTAEVYRLYYAKLHEAKNEIIQKYGKGLILNIHSSNTWQHDVYFGTGGMKAVKPLIKRSGFNAYTGEFSIQQTLSDKGYEIPGYKNIPSEQGPTGNVNRALTWIEKDSKLDAIEIEINGKKHLEEQESLAKFSEDFGEAVLKFLHKYYL